MHYRIVELGVEYFEIERRVMNWLPGQYKWVPLTFTFYARKRKLKRCRSNNTPMYFRSAESAEQTLNRLRKSLQRRKEKTTHLKVEKIIVKEFEF